MKKTLIVLLSLLIVFSFASCEKDKSAEMVKAYEDFASSFDAGLQKAYSVASMLYPTSDKEVDLSTAVPTTEQIATIYNQLFSESITVTDNSIKASRKIACSLKKSDDDKTTTGTIKASDVSITFKYKPTSSSESGDAEEKDGSLSFNVEGTIVGTEIDENTTSTSLEFKNISFQGSSFSDIAFSYEKGAITSASVGGTDVNLTLLNNSGKLAYLAYILK